MNGDNIPELDAHIAQAPIRLTDLETKQASLVLISSFIVKLGHGAQQNTEALNITFVKSLSN